MDVKQYGRRRRRAEEGGKGGGGGNVCVGCAEGPYRGKSTFETAPLG